MPYVIYGDVHGCLEEWEELRKLIPKNSMNISIKLGVYPKKTLKLIMGG